MDLRSHPQIETAAQLTLPLLDGSWEQSGRSLNTAALLGVLGIGALYFNAQSILVAIMFAGIQLTSGGPNLTGNFPEQLSETVKFYANPLRISVLISQFAFMLFPALWLVKRWHTSEVREYIRLRSSSTKEILLATLATLTMIPAGNFIADYLVRQMRIPEKLLEINAEIFTARSPGEFFWLVIVVCLTPAICEEVFFRGFVQRTFERTIQWKSVVLIGVLFGLFHFQPLGLVTLSILGILLGYFFYRSKSLLPSMAAHFANNFVAILLLYQTPELQKTETSPASAQIPLWLVGATLPVGVGILYFYHKLTRKHIVV